MVFWRLEIGVLEPLFNDFE